MTTTMPATPHRSSTRPSAAGAVLAVGAGLSAVAFAIAVVGLIVDPTVLTGAPAWMKPAKFSFSIAVYLLTLRWILSHVRGHARLLAVLSTVITVALVAEIALVEMQVLRGTTSHYNESSDLDAAEDLHLDEHDLGDESHRDDGAEHRQQPSVAPDVRQDPAQRQQVDRDRERELGRFHPGGSACCLLYTSPSPRDS